MSSAASEQDDPRAVGAAEAPCPDFAKMAWNTRAACCRSAGRGAAVRAYHPELAAAHA